MISIKGKINSWECVFRECNALCCTPPLITIGDAKRISKSIGLKPAEFLDAINGGDKGLFRVRSRGEKCMFLKEDYICKLHGKNSKPIFCQMFPFRFDGITYSDDIILKIKLSDNCPGHNRGKKIGDEFMLNIEELGSRFVREVEGYLKLGNRGKKFGEIFEAGV